MNLLQSTIEALAEHNHTPGGVEWVGTSDGAFASSWDVFAPMAELMDRLIECNPNLVVVGYDWWLKRAVEEGWGRYWEFCTKPVICQGKLLTEKELEYQYLSRS